MTDRTSTQLLAEQPQHLSHSQLNSLVTCGERYRLERGLGLSGPPSWAAIGGSAVHSATEAYDLAHFYNDFEGAQYSFEYHFRIKVALEAEKSGLPESEFKAWGRASKQWPNKENKEWWLENGEVLVQNWIDWRAACPWRVLDWKGTPAIEVKVLVELGGRPNVMYIDRLMVAPDGTVGVLDLKTGSRKLPPFQLGQYKVGAEMLDDPIPVSWGCFWMARQNQSTPPEDLSRFDQAYLDELYWRGSQIITQGLFLPSPDQHCDWCGVSPYCRSYGGAKAHLSQGSHVSLSAERND